MGVRNNKPKTLEMSIIGPVQISCTATDLYGRIASSR